MQIPVQTFPVLSAGQMSPFHQALQTGLEDYSNMTKAAYQPATLQADIASKAAYATYSPYSYLSKALSDPMTLAALSNNPEQLKAVMGRLASMPTNPYQSLGMTGMPGMGGSNGGASTGIGGLWDRLTGKSSGQQSPQASGDNSGMSFDQNGNNVRATPQEVAQVANQGNGATAPATSGGSGNFPLTPENLRQQALIKAFPNSPQALQVKAQNDLWQKRLEEEGKTVDDTQKAITTLDTMKQVYPQLKSYEKGVGFGSAPAISSNAQIFDQLAQNQASTNIRALQSGHITNSDFVIANKLKPNRAMNEDAFTKMEEYNQALSLRARQKQRFMADAYNKGMPIQNADTTWSSFIEQHPLFDPKSQKLNEQNATISPFNAPVYSAPSSSSRGAAPVEGGWPSGKSPVNENDPLVQGRMPPAGAVWMVRPDGMQVAVHRENIKMAKDKYKFRGIND